MLEEVIIGNCILYLLLGSVVENERKINFIYFDYVLLCCVHEFGERKIVEIKADAHNYGEEKIFISINKCCFFIEWANTKLNQFEKFFLD